MKTFTAKKIVAIFTAVSLAFLQAVPAGVAATNPSDFSNKKGVSGPAVDALKTETTNVPDPKIPADPNLESPLSPPTKGDDVALTQTNTASFDFSYSVKDTPAQTIAPAKGDGVAATQTHTASFDYSYSVKDTPAQTIAPVGTVSGKAGGLIGSSAQSGTNLNSVPAPASVSAVTTQRLELGALPQPGAVKATNGQVGATMISTATTVTTDDPAVEDASTAGLTNEELQAQIDQLRGEANALEAQAVAQTEHASALSEEAALARRIGEQMIAQAQEYLRIAQAQLQQRESQLQAAQSAMAAVQAHEAAIKARLALLEKTGRASRPGSAGIANRPVSTEIAKLKVELAAITKQKAAIVRQTANAQAMIRDAHVRQQSASADMALGNRKLQSANELSRQSDVKLADAQALRIRVAAKAAEANVLKTQLIPPVVEQYMNELKAALGAEYALTSTLSPEKLLPPRYLVTALYTSKVLRQGQLRTLVVIVNTDGSFAGLQGATFDGVQNVNAQLLFGALQQLDDATSASLAEATARLQASVHAATYWQMEAERLQELAITANQNASWKTHDANAHQAEYNANQAEIDKLIEKKGNNCNHTCQVTADRFIAEYRGYQAQNLRDKEEDLRDSQNYRNSASSYASQASAANAQALSYANAAANYQKQANDLLKTRERLALVQMTKITVTSVDATGAIFFAQGDKNYKGYRDAVGNVKVEEVVTIPPAVQAYVDQLQQQVGEGFLVVASPWRGGGYTVLVTNKAIATSGLKELRFFLNEQGNILGSISQISVTYFGSNGDINLASNSGLLFEGMKLLEVGIPETADIRALTLMSKISVTSVDANGEIYFTQGGVNYRCYRNSEGVLIIVTQYQNIRPPDVFQAAQANLSPEELAQLNQAMRDVGPNTEYAMNVSQNGQDRSWTWASGSDPKKTYILSQSMVSQVQPDGRAVQVIARWNFATQVKVSLPEFFANLNIQLATDAERRALEAALADVGPNSVFTMQVGENGKDRSWTWTSASDPNKTYVVSRQIVKVQQADGSLREVVQWNFATQIKITPAQFLTQVMNTQLLPPDQRAQFLTALRDVGPNTEYAMNVSQNGQDRSWTWASGSDPKKTYILSQSMVSQVQPDGTIKMVAQWSFSAQTQVTKTEVTQYANPLDPVSQASLLQALAQVDASTVFTKSVSGDSVSYSWGKPQDLATTYIVSVEMVQIQNADGTITERPEISFSIQTKITQTEIEVAMKVAQEQLRSAAASVREAADAQAQASAADAQRVTQEQAAAIAEQNAAQAVAAAKVAQDQANTAAFAARNAAQERAAAEAEARTAQSQADVAAAAARIAAQQRVVAEDEMSLAQVQANVAAEAANRASRSQLAAATQAAQRAMQRAAAAQVAVNEAQAQAQAAGEAARSAMQRSAAAQSAMNEAQVQAQAAGEAARRAAQMMAAAAAATEVAKAQTQVAAESAKRAVQMRAVAEAAVNAAQAKYSAAAENIRLLEQMLASGTAGAPHRIPMVR